MKVELPSFNGNVSIEEYLDLSRNPEEKHTRCSLDGIETKLLVPGSKPRIHEGFLEFTR